MRYAAIMENRRIRAEIIQKAYRLHRVRVEGEYLPSLVRYGRGGFVAMYYGGGRDYV